MESIKFDIHSSPEGDSALVFSLIETGNSAHDRNSFLAAALELLVQTFKANLGLIYFIEPESSTARLAFSVNLSDAVKERVSVVTMNDSPLIKRLASGNITIFNMGDYPDISDIISEDRIPKIAAFPLYTKGKVIGTVNIGFDIHFDIEAHLRAQIGLATRTVGIILDRFDAEEQISAISRDTALKEELFSFALDATGDGVWDWDLEKDAITCSPRCLEMLGLPAKTPAASRTQMSQVIHPDDRDHILRLLNDYCEGKRSSYEAEIRVKGEGNTWRWVCHKGRIVTRDSSGKPLRLVGVIMDISRRKTLEEILLDLGERYKTVVNKANEGIFIVQNGKLVFCNPKMVDITGYSLDELYAYPITTIIHPDDCDRVTTLFADRIAGNDTPHHSIFRVIDSGGRELWIEDSSSPINWNNAPALLDFITDITDRMKAEKAVIESEERYRHVFLHSPVGIFRFDGTFRITECNERFTEIMESSRELIVGTDLTSITDPLIQQIIEKTKNNLPVKMEGEYHTITSGNTINISFSGALIHNAEGSLSGGIGIVEDISSRVKSEHIIRQYVKHLVSVDKISQLTSSPMEKSVLIKTLIREVRRIFQCDRAWIIYPCDPASPTWHYMQINTAPNHAISFTVDADRTITPVIADLFARAAASKTPIADNEFPSPSSIEQDSSSQMVIALHSAADGDWLLGVNQSDPARKWTDDEMKLLRDIAQRLTDALNNFILQSKIQERGQFVSAVLRATDDAIIVIDSAGTIVRFNDRAAALSGLSIEDVIGKQADSVIILHDTNTGAPIESPVKRVLSENRTIDSVTPVVISAGNGNACTVQTLCVPVTSIVGTMAGCVLILKDITEKIRIGRELSRGQKFESIGIIAGGIAHDFNNILTGITGNLSLAKMRADDKEKSAKLVSDAEKAAFRAQKLTQQLLSFTKGGTPSREMISLKEIVEESSSFALRGSNVVCRNEFADNIPPISADRGQISQVIQNIIINALQAMKDGGRITNKIDTIISVGADIPAGNFVRLSISDTGAGIPKKNIPHIFDPYFSTKETGSGLGLAVVSSIIMNHGGHVSVRSVPNEGTTFTILLPAAKTIQQQEKAETREIIRGTGKILLMDDDESVQHVVASILDCLGYRVHCAFNGEEAVNMYRTACAKNIPFDLVIMDLTIPGGMGGKDAVAEIRKIDPACKAIVSSGYSNDPVISNYGDYGFSGVIVKPFSIEELSQTISAVLASKQEP